MSTQSVKAWLQRGGDWMCRIWIAALCATMLLLIGCKGSGEPLSPVSYEELCGLARGQIGVMNEEEVRLPAPANRQRETGSRILAAAEERGSGSQAGERARVGGIRLVFFCRDTAAAPYGFLAALAPGIRLVKFGFLQLSEEMRGLIVEKLMALCQPQESDSQSARFS